MKKRSATVETFLVILGGHLTQYDRRQSARYSCWNPYALSHYMGGVRKVEARVKAHLKSDSPQAMEALKAALEIEFINLTPVNAVVRKINNWLKNGKPPRYPVTRKKKA